MHVSFLNSLFYLALAIILVTEMSCSETSPFVSSPSESLPGDEMTTDLNQSDQPNTTSEGNRVKKRGLSQLALYDPDDIEPGQVCVINANQEEAQEIDQYASSQEYTKKKRRVLEGLGFVISIFQVPEGRTVKEGIAELRQEFPSQIIDANHRYNLQETEKKMDPRRYGHQLVGWNEQAVSCGMEKLRIGMVDTSIDVSHALLKNESIHTQSFLSETTPHAPDQHGTAVAILLVANSPQVENGLLPRASLFAAETFRQVKLGKVEATTWSIVRALDWLVTENVHVINLSLGGPQNALLTFAIQQTIDSNIPIVAAAGNSGPSGNPMYPAAENGVIAVTALDAELNPYPHASRGSYIAFSAPGVDIWVPNGKKTGVFKSGTSFAAPFVTTAAAAWKLSHPQGTPRQVAHQLAHEAVDLGKPGKDEIFGWGLVQIPNTCSTHPPAPSM